MSMIPPTPPVSRSDSIAAVRCRICADSSGLTLDEEGFICRDKKKCEHNLWLK